MSAVATAGSVDPLAAGAPDAIAAWHGIEAGRPLELRREVRRRAGPEAQALMHLEQLHRLADRSPSA